MTEIAKTRERGAADVRPGAMTRAMRAVPREPRSKVRALRWALVRDGRIVSEAIVPPERALSVGAGADVPCAEVRERALAWCEGGRWRMRVSPAWSGRIGEAALAELIAGEPRGDDGWIELALDDGARARVVIGDHALLVQLVDRPPARTRPQLPAALTGGLFRRADWMFTAFIAASFLLHFAFVVGLIEADWPVETALIPARDAEIIFTPIETPDPQTTPEEPMLADATDTPSETETTDTPTNSTPTPNPNRRTNAPPRRTSTAEANLAAREAFAAANVLLGSVGQGGAMDTLLEEGGSFANAEGVMAQASSAAIARNEAGIIDERGPGGCATCDRTGPLGDLAANHHGTGPVGEGPPIREVVIPRVIPDEIDPIDPLPPGFDTRDLIGALRMRMTAVQRCYEHELTRGNPDTEGRLTIAITVMPVGSVANLRADENETGSEALAACTIRSLRNTRVRVGPSEPVEVNYPIVFRRPG